MALRLVRGEIAVLLVADGSLNAAPEWAVSDRPQQRSQELQHRFSLALWSSGDTLLSSIRATVDGIDDHVLRGILPAALRLRLYDANRKEWRSEQKIYCSFSAGEMPNAYFLRRMHIFFRQKSELCHRDCCGPAFVIRCQCVPHGLV